MVAKPPIPAIATRLLTHRPIGFTEHVEKVDHLLADPDCSPQVLAAIISTDPVLSSLILSRANAGRSENGEEVLHLPQAIVMLGLSMVQGLVREIRPVPAKQRAWQASIWAGANAVATMARVLSEHCPARIPVHDDDALLHMLGLTHVLGDIVFAHEYPEHLAAASQAHAQSEDPAFAHRTREALGLDAHRLGILLAKGWALPTPIQAILRWYPRPLEAEMYREHACLVHTARNLVKALGFHFGDDRYVEAIDLNVLEAIGLPMRDLHTAMKRFYAILPEIELYEAYFATPGKAAGVVNKRSDARAVGAGNGSSAARDPHAS